MKLLLAATCLIATIWAFSFENYDFNVVIDKVEYSNVPGNYSLNLDAFVPQLREIAKDVAPRGPLAGTEAVVNDYADKIFANLRQLMIVDGFDPFPMPDEHSGFSYTLIITYSGELDLSHGWLQDLSTMKRGGDVVVDYSSNTKYLSVSIPIVFDDLQFSYDYVAKIMGLGPTGAVQGKISSVRVTVTIGFDTEKLVASLDEFYITNSGHIDLKFSGNSLVDWLFNLLSEIVTTLLKEVILLIVENIIRGGLSSAVDAINSAVDGILNPVTAAAPEATIVGLFFNN